MPLIGTTWTCTWGTSNPAIMSRHGRGRECFLRLTDAVRDGHEVGSGGSIEIGPLVDLDTGHDEDMAVSEGTHVEEGDTDVVGPDEASGDLAGDDAGEDGRHAGIVGCGP